MRDYIRTGLLYFLAIATIAAVLVVLRSRNGTSNVALRDVRTTSATMQVSAGYRRDPLINETAPSRVATLRGWDATYVEQGSQPAQTRTHVVSTAVAALTLRRRDQLHVKDIIVKPETRLTISAENRMLELVFDGGRDCCRGQIGVGESVGTSSETLKTTRFEKHRIDPAWPNLMLRCVTPPCSISLDLLSDEVSGIIEDGPIGSVSFNKPGTTATSVDSFGESAIIGGSFEVKANDLLGNEFALRKVPLSSGDSVAIEANSGGVSLDVRDKVLLINSVSDRVGALRYRPRSGTERNMLPSLLELLLREPWRPSLFAIIVGIAPGLVAFIKARLASRSKKGG